MPCRCCSVSLCPCSQLDLYCWQELRWLSRFRQLLEAIGDLQQRRLTPGAAKERDPNRQPKDKSCGDIDVWIPRHRCRIRTAASKVIAVCEVGEPRRPARWCDQRVELILVHHTVDSFFARESVIRGQRIKIFLFCQGPLLLSLEEQ